MDLGAEIKRDSCPKKYCSRSSLIKDILPGAIAFLLVDIYSANMMSGVLNVAVNLIFALAIYVLFMSFLYLMFKGVKKRMAETYIVLCERGIKGICPINGYKNREFSVPYSEITDIKASKERIVITAGKEKVPLMVHDSKELERLIREHGNI